VRGSRWSAEEILDKIGVPGHCSWTELIEKVGEHAGRKIEVIGAPGGDLPSGLMYLTPEGYTIVYRLEDPSLYKQHSSFHEIGHIILDHDGCVVLDGVSPSRIRELGLGGTILLRARSGDIDDEERAAEEMAYAIARRVLPTPSLRSEAFGI
jgi:hypothetical protein